MSNIETYSYLTDSEEQTKHLGKELAKIAQKGDVFALFGTLGMGKSVLARAIIQELSGAKEVPSPTFTLVQSYEGSDVEIFHYDLYRIKNPEEIFEIGMEESMYTGINLVEWPEMMGPYLPKDIFKVEFENCGEQRKIVITAFSDNKAGRLRSIKEQKND